MRRTENRADPLGILGTVQDSLSITLHPVTCVHLWLFGHQTFCPMKCLQPHRILQPHANVHSVSTLTGMVTICSARSLFLASYCHPETEPGVLADWAESIGELEFKSPFMGSPEAFAV